MMTWNYRVFREPSGEYVIREVFYTDTGALLTCTHDPVEPVGATFDELAQDIAWFQEALALPVLTLGDFPPDEPSALSAPHRLFNRQQNRSLEAVLADLQEPAIPAGTPRTTEDGPTDK